MKIWICKNCWKRNKKIVIVHKGSPPEHAGHVQCKICEERGTHYNPMEAITQAEVRIDALHRQIDSHLEAAAELDCYLAAQEPVKMDRWTKFWLNYC